MSRTGRIKALSGALTHSGKPYKIIEMEDGEKIRAFDAKQTEGLAPGMEVDFILTKNARSGYWDLSEIHRVGTKPERDLGEPSRDQAATEGGVERYLGERERGMRSMNALTNATTLLAALIKRTSSDPPALSRPAA